MLFIRITLFITVINILHFGNTRSDSTLTQCCINHKAAFACKTGGREGNRTCVRVLLKSLGLRFFMQKKKINLAETRMLGSGDFSFTKN